MNRIVMCCATHQQCTLLFQRVSSAEREWSGCCHSWQWTLETGTSANIYKMRPPMLGDPSLPWTHTPPHARTRTHTINWYPGLVSLSPKQHILITNESWSEPQWWLMGDGQGSPSCHGFGIGSELGETFDWCGLWENIPFQNIYWTRHC